MKWIYFSLGVLLCFVACSPSEPASAPKPNILFIAVDDLRPDLGCYGNKEVHSPNLDRLAAESFLFTRHYVQVPTCGASRQSMLTGLRPISRAHLRNNITANILSDSLEPAIPESFVHHLKRNGYHTTGIGKITHSADGYVYGYTDPISTRRELPFSWDDLDFDYGKWGTGWNAFFGYANGENRQSMDSQVKPYEKGEVDEMGYPDGLTAQLAKDKLAALSQHGQPFFLGVGFFKPHLPFTSPARYWDLYNPDSLSISPNPTLPQNVHPKSLHQNGEFNRYALGEEKASLTQPVSTAYAQKLRQAYYASISYTDYLIGQVLEKLETLGLAENTIVVIWGDHGWHLGDQQIWGKHTLFENSLRSTFMIKAPGLETPPKLVDALIESVDIYPSLMELCGIALPYEMDGESFLPLLGNAPASEPVAAYSYFREGISLRTDRYRLTQYFREESPTVELYDHQADPYETVNVAADHPGVISQLMPLLKAGDTGLYEPH